MSIHVCITLTYDNQNVNKYVNLLSKWTPENFSKVLLSILKTSFSILILLQELLSE